MNMQPDDFLSEEYDLRSAWANNIKQAAYCTTTAMYKFAVNYGVPKPRNARGGCRDLYRQY